MPSSSSRLPLLLATAAAFLVPAVLIAAPAQAQYFRPAAPGGYLPDTPRPDAKPTFSTQTPYQRPFLELGIAGGIGLGVMPMGRLDEDFFEPNRAHPFHVTVPVTLDASGWIEIAQSFRIGLHGSGRWAVGSDEYLGYGSGGLLLEGGGGDEIQIWFGGVIGGGGLRTEAEDFYGNLYLYDASLFTTRLHMHVAYALTPWTDVRLTPWIEVGWSTDERFGSSRPLYYVTIPDTPEFNPVSFGLSFSLEFHTN